MADTRIPKPGLPAAAATDEAMIKGVLAVLILCFARKPESIVHSSGMALKPYTPPEAIGVVDYIFDKLAED